MRGTQRAQEKIIMIVELNIAGYRFCGEIPALRRKSLRPLRFGQHNVHWRMPQLRHSHAA
jgi:hypothetical protein